MSTSGKKEAPRMARKLEPAACPFCEEKVARPRLLVENPGPDAPRGGRCSCGALFLVDENGRGGGQALLDALTLACDGDVARGMAMRSGIDYRLESVGYSPRTHTLDPRGGSRFGQPKLWFLRLTDRSP